MFHHFPTRSKNVPVFTYVDGIRKGLLEVSPNSQLGANLFAGYLCWWHNVSGMTDSCCRGRLIHRHRTPIRYSVSSHTGNLQWLAVPSGVNSNFLKRRIRIYIAIIRYMQYFCFSHCSLFAFFKIINRTLMSNSSLCASFADIFRLLWNFIAFISQTLWRKLAIRTKKFQVTLQLLYE